MQYDKNSASKPVLGLNKDVHPSEQPKETIRFALNAVKEDNTGNYNNYQSEPSNKICLELEEGYKVIGSIYLEDRDKVLFVTNNITSKIILLSSNCKATELVSNTCLGFNTQYTITGEYRVREGCNRVIYYCDNFNPDRFLDLDDLDSFKDSSGNWDCNLMQLTPEFKIPQVSITSVNNSGGTLPVGSYSFAVELLDNNLNSIDYGVFTNYIPVYNDSTSDNYESVQGALPSPQFNSNVGGVDNTSKSFSLNLTNLDTSFSFARLIVFYRGTDTGEVEAAYKLEDFIPITSSTIDYTFSSLANATLDDSTKYKIPKQKYTSSNVMEQVQNRLVRAGMREDVRDYSQYQRVVNNITVRWKSIAENPRDISAKHNTKNPLSYQNGNTFLPDEIYALGIEYIFNDGTISPVFHIPGRAPTPSDLENLTVGTDIELADVAHLELSIGDTIPRWQFENTSTGTVGGTLGYYQTNTNYPNTLDCNNEPIYGELANTPIRHHKIPCRSNLVPAFVGSDGKLRVNKIGIEFNNITYPSSDIVGHRFVSAKRKDSDTTVVDNGYLVGISRQTYHDNNDIVFSSISSRSYYGSIIDGTDVNNVKAIISPKILSGEISNFDYLKFTYYSPDSEQEYSNLSEAFGQLRISSFKRNLDYPVTQYNNKYRNVTESKLINANSTFNGDFPFNVVNGSFSNGMFVVSMSDNMPDISTGGFTETAFVSMKRNVTPFSNLFQLQYEPITPVLNLLDSQLTRNGKAFTNHLDVANIFRIVSNVEGEFLPELFGDNIVQIRAEYFANLFVDSTINYELRVEGTDCNTIFNDQGNLGLYIANKVADASNDWALRPGVCKEYYRYNRDYAPLNTNVGIPIPFNFDYCDKCLAERPNRIVFSPKSFNEEISDYYRLNFVDDYIDLPYHRGKITGIKYKNNKLYVHTEQTTFILQPNPQFISTDQNTAYLNTGDFLSIPPYEIMQTDLGYGGLQHKLGASNSEYGYVWYDTLNQKVLSLTSGINNLTNSGMSQWFKENSRFTLNKFIKQITGKKYVRFDSINDSNGIGISCIYDPRFERVIINKKDYLPKDNYEGTITNSTNLNRLQTGKFYFNTSTNQFVIKENNTIVPLDLNNTTYFYNTGWVISYSFKHQAFISYHSYLTDIMFNDETYFYSVKNNKVYQHLHKDSFTNYYNTQYPFIIEYVANDFATDIVKSIQYYATFTEGESEINTNYNNLLAYNSKQSTGKLELLNIDQHNNPYATLINVPNIKSVITTDLNSKINNLWDYSTANSVISKEEVDKEQERQLNGYIDLVPVNIDYTKSPYEAGELRDKYLITRLFYYPNKNTEKVTHRLSNTIELVSVR